MSLEDVKKRTTPVGKVKGIVEYLEDNGGNGGDVTWEDVQGKPSEFPPENHNHSIGDVSDLQSEIDGIKARLDALENGGEG